MGNLIEQNVVVLGSLNPAILQPNWLAKEDVGLLPVGEKITVNYILGGPTQYQGKVFSWSVDYGSLKINISPDNSPSLLKDFVIKVFRELKHTPVTAMGQNFVFEESNWPLDMKLGATDNLKIGANTNWGMVQNLIQEVKLKIQDKAELNINFNQNEGKTRIRFNFHYNVSDTADLTQISENIEGNFEEAKKILQEIKK